MGKFQNKVVIITGASSGIGEAAAIDFAKEGAKVVITGRNKERLSAVAEKCKSAGAEVHEFIGDLADFNILEPIINETVQKFGGIDILVNNAGFGHAKLIEQTDLDAYTKIFDINVKAPVFLCKLALPYLKKSKGCVVNVSSISGIKAGPHYVPYCMTKAALDHFSRGFSAECAPFGVRVNSINPAVTDTRFGVSMGFSEEELKKSLAQHTKYQPLGVISPHQVSEGIQYLCCSQMTTGITLTMDGGCLHKS